jgi:hypothetical protein
MNNTDASDNTCSVIMLIVPNVGRLEVKSFRAGFLFCDFDQQIQFSIFVGM